MVNSDFGPAFILGVALVLSGVALYGMRSFRPELSRDHDIFFAAIALVSGLILIFQGWRLDPLLFLGQLSLAGSAGFFAFENIRLRGVTTEQAKKNTPIVDDDRPVSRRYEYDYDYDAEFDELPSRDRRSSRSIRASREDRAAAFEDDYRSERRRPPSRSSSRRRRIETDDNYRRPAYAPESRSRRRLPRARRDDDDRPVEADAAWDDRGRDEWDDRPPQRDKPTWDVSSPEAGTDPVIRSNDSDTPSGVGSTYRSGGREPKSLSRYRRRRASSDSRSSYRSSSEERMPESYADYQPLNETGADDDNY